MTTEGVTRPDDCVCDDVLIDWVRAIMIHTDYDCPHGPRRPAASERG